MSAPPGLERWRVTWRQSVPSLARLLWGARDLPASHWPAPVLIAVEVPVDVRPELPGRPDPAAGAAAALDLWQMQFAADDVELVRLERVE